MSELFAAPIETNKALDDLGIDQFRSSNSEVLGATWDETLATNPAELLTRALKRGATNRPEVESTPYSEWNLVTPDPGVTVPNPYYVESPLLTAEEANAKFGITSNGKRLLGWDAPVREREAKELQGLKRDELLRQSIISRGSDGAFMGVASFAVGAAGSIIDPLNILSAFVPVVGEANFARILGVVGSKTAARAITGVIEGGVGAAMLEPMVYGLSRQEQRDYTMTNSMYNLAFGSVLGGAFHVGGGFVKDRITGIPKIIDDAPLETKRAMLGEAIVGILEDRPIRADLPLREWMLSGTMYSETPYAMATRIFNDLSGKLVEVLPTRDVVPINPGLDPRIAGRMEAIRNSKIGETTPVDTGLDPRLGDQLRDVTSARKGDASWTPNEDGMARLDPRIGRDMDAINARRETMPVPQPEKMDLGLDPQIANKMEWLVKDKAPMRAVRPPPHPAPDLNGSLVPVLDRKGSVRMFSGEKTATNAAEKIRKEGGEASVLATPDGYILRVASKMEPLRELDGSVMKFDSPAAAKSYMEGTPLKDDYQAIPIGSKEYALVRGATDSDIAAAKKAPSNIEFPPSRDSSAIIDDFAKEIEGYRAGYQNEVRGYVNDRINPPVRASAADLRIHDDNNARIERSNGERESIRREGGKTELSLLDRDIADLDAQIKAVDQVGELDPEMKSYLAEGDALVAKAEAERDLLNRIAACIRGVA